MELNQIMAKRVYDLCAKKGITIYKFSQLCDVPENTLRSMKDSLGKNCAFDTIYKIAWGFGMSVDEFCDFPEFHNYYLKTSANDMQDE